MIYFMLALVSQLSFTPVTPCRVVDTRVPSAVNMVVPGNGFIAFMVSGNGNRVGFKDRGFDVPIPFSFVDQGGEIDGCDIPRTASAVTMTVTAIPISGDAGYLIVWKHAVDYYLSFGGAPVLVPAPHAATVTWNAGEAVSTTHVISSVCVESTAPFADCNEDIVAEAHGSAAHVIIDVYGYFR